MTISALIFDVDGTLADTEEAHRQAFNATFANHCLGWHWSPAEYRALLKTTGGKERIAAYIDSLVMTAAERRTLLGLVPALHAEKNRRYAASVADGQLPLRDGIARLIDEAMTAGCRLAIASTTSAENVEALLDATLGSAVFQVIACGDTVAAKKPAPDIYLAALAALTLRADEAIAIEDSGPGLASAAAAGLWTLVIPNVWTADSDFSAANLVLPRAPRFAALLRHHRSTTARRL
jgi:HAD superfamily hydrolase (TIGR01509 family)